MSLSKPIPLCRFCEEEKGKYMCPRCNIRYCSGKCYKDPAHERCTEMFFQEWFMTTLREQSAQEAEKQKMLQILKNASEEEKVKEEEENCSSEDLPIEDRFRDLNLDSDISEKLIWDRLSQEEKDHFKEVLKDENELDKIIPIKQPWWTISEINLIMKKPDNKGSDFSVATRPPLPIDIKSLSTLTTQFPADTIQYNIINVLYAYVFLVKFHNSDLREFIEEIVDSVLYLCPVLSCKKNYLSLEESVQDSIRLLTSSHFQVTMSDAKALCYDICSIINGPSNVQPNSYVLCALNDLKMLIVEFKMLSKTEKTALPKNVRQTLHQAIKKIDFYLSWTVDYYETNLKRMSLDIELNYLPEIMTDSFDKKACSAVITESKTHSDSKKVLIEELN